MERRDFITAAFALALVPSAAAAKSPRLRELKRQMRECFGPQAQEIMLIVESECRAVLDENPELAKNIRRGREEDLERLTDLGMERCMAQLRTQGLWEDYEA